MDIVSIIIILVIAIAIYIFMSRYNPSNMFKDAINAASDAVKGGVNAGSDAVKSGVNTGADAVKGRINDGKNIVNDSVPNKIITNAKDAIPIKIPTLSINGLQNPTNILKTPINVVNSIF